MKVSLEEAAQPAASGGQRMSPPSHARKKSDMGSIVVDMGNRGGGEVEVRAMDMYSPNNKKAAARPDPAFRIHFIPLLMIVVFIVLWAGSTEVPLGEDLKLGAATEKNLATFGQQKVEVSQHDSPPGTELQDVHDHGAHHEDASLSTNEKAYLRGTSSR